VLGIILMNLTQGTSIVLTAQTFGRFLLQISQLNYFYKFIIFSAAIKKESGIIIRRLGDSEVHSSDIPFI
jgi:hypothetical protein